MCPSCPRSLPCWWLLGPALGSLCLLVPPRSFPWLLQSCSPQVFLPFCSCPPRPGMPLPAPHPSVRRGVMKRSRQARAALANLQVPPGYAPPPSIAPLISAMLPLPGAGKATEPMGIWGGPHGAESTRARGAQGPTVASRHPAWPWPRGRGPVLNPPSRGGGHGAGSCPRGEGAGQLLYLRFMRAPSCPSRRFQFRLSVFPH